MTNLNGQVGERLAGWMDGWMDTGTDKAAISYSIQNVVSNSNPSAERTDPPYNGRLTTHASFIY